MNDDPYASPPPPAPFRSPPPATFGGGGAFAPGEVISAGWDRFGKHVLVLVGAYVVTVMVNEVFQAPLIGVDVLERLRPELVAWAPSRIMRLLIVFPFGFVVGSFLDVGLLRLTLQVARGESPSFGTIFSGADRWLSFMGLSVLIWTGVAIGLLLLIVPGVILGLGWSMAPYYLVDANLGPVESLRASWGATKGVRGSLAVLFLATFGIGLLGLASCCVGMLAAAPLAMVIHAVAYLRIAGAGASLGRAAQPADWEG
ncbi:MAG: hypothetical protein FWD17_19610 [Polyangiaceae bacterium]|nr:hypothetical protein [Polyangiaceae bacterium]